MFSMVIADDEWITREGLKSMNWAEEGYEIKAVASDGEEALDAIQRHKPHIVLTDIRMPCLDGLALTKFISEHLPRTKVILMTAYHDYEYALTAIELGVTGFILKPTEPEDILRACRKARSLIEDEQRRATLENRLRKQIEEYQVAEGEKMAIDPGQVGHEAVLEVLRYIQEHFMDELTISQAAAKVYLNPAYLSRLIKQETGQNFSEIITRVRMQKAVDLLKDPNLKVYEIAGQVGFQDARYFSQLFKKYYGLTPMEFRENLHADDKKEGQDA